MRVCGGQPVPVEYFSYPIDSDPHVTLTTPHGHSGRGVCRDFVLLRKVFDDER